MTDDVLVNLTDGLMTVTLNRPESLNALDVPTETALLAAIRRAKTEARALLIQGSDRAFSSGADLNAISDDGETEHGTVLDVINEIQRELTSLPIPTVAGVSGPAAGVGCSIALMCDYVVMSEKSYFMLAFTGIGLLPDGGATALVAASAGRHRAMRMALTAEKVHAATALEWGMASEVVAAQDWAARAAEVARGFAAGATKAIAAAKTAINQATLGQLDATLDREAVRQESLLISADFKEGATAFLEKRPARFTGR